MVHAVDEFIGSIGGFFVVGLRLFAQTLQGWVPIPWPLTILAFAPLAFVVLAWRGGTVFAFATIVASAEGIDQILWVLNPAKLSSISAAQ